MRMLVNYANLNTQKKPPTAEGKFGCNIKKSACILAWCHLVIDNPNLIIPYPHANLIRKRNVICNLVVRKRRNV